MDPEDVKALTQRCIERLCEEVRRFGGTVLDTLGDEVFAAFGAPLAHEDDAERAVRAGLAMRDCPVSGELAYPIKIHVGINTGEVMAGEVGPKENRQYRVVGDVTNTAARLRSAAPPGTVFVGEETFRSTHRIVDYRVVPPIDAKGKERPVLAWEALGALSLPERRPLGTAPLVGRDDELRVLSGIWAKTLRENRPHLVTILGESGIGKSRLAAEFTGQITKDALVLHGRCLSYGEVLGYWALATVLKGAAGIKVEDDPEAARVKLADLVAQVISPTSNEDPTEVARHLALLSGLDTTADRTDNAPDQKTLHASTRRFLEAFARTRPLCVHFEDIHWADDALLDLIEFVAARAHDVPLLIVAQARPELLEKRPSWGRGVRGFTSLSLEALDEDARRELIQVLCDQQRLSVEVSEHVSRVAGGNPLFAEELVATIAERGSADAVPVAIKGLIAARLDALPAAERKGLQVAAVCGKAFWEGGLRALGMPAALTEHLDALEQKDLIRAEPQSQFRGEREYTFKHDLIRDVAYETLPRATRRQLHGQVADWIEETWGQRAEERLDLLAHHAIQAEQHERALDYLTRAAERARRAAAHREEAALLAQAIGIAEGMGRRARQAELRARRGKALSDVGMWLEARPDLEAALEALGSEALERRAEVLVDLSTVCFWLLDSAGSRRHSKDAAALAKQVGREDLTIEAMGLDASAEGADGDVVRAIDKFRSAITRARGGDIPLPTCLHQFPLALYWTGQLHEAVESGHEAVQVARRISNASATMYALPHLGLALAGSGQYDEATRIFAEARRFGREYGVDTFLARAIAMSAGLYLDVFDFSRAVALAEEAREMARSINFRPPEVSAGIDLLLNFARRDDVGRAEQLVREVAEAVDKAAGWHGWLWKLRLAEARAELALVREDREEALRWANDAIELSRAKGRVKYHVAGLATRAKALRSLGRTHEAITDLQTAVALARPVGDPAMFLRTAAMLLQVEGNDALAGEARAAVDRIAGALPDGEMRRQFESAEPVRSVIKLTS
jgi:tetratricopeptide (TPR) repeat protein